MGKLDIYQSNAFEILSKKIIEFTFGECAARVVAALHKTSRASIDELKTLTQLPRKQVVTSLSSLRYHEIVTVFKDDNRILSSWQLNKPNIFYLLSKSRYTTHIQRRFGNTSELVIEHILKFGKSTASQLMIAVCFKMARNLKEFSITNEILTKARNEFKTLVLKQYIKRVSVSDRLSLKKVDIKYTAQDVGKEDEFRYHDEFIDLKLIEKEVEKLHHQANGQAFKKEDEDQQYSNFYDKDIYWTINHDAFHLEWRDELLGQVICARIGGPKAHLVKQVFDALMIEAFSQVENKWANNIFVTSAHVKRRLPNHPCVDQCLTVLEVDCSGCVRREGTGGGGGEYLLDVASIIEKFTQEFVCKGIANRFTSDAARIFRFQLKVPMVNQDLLASETMIPRKDSDSLSNNLVANDYFKIVDITKPGPNKNKDLYHTTTYFHDVVDLVARHCFKALYHCLIKRERLTEENQSLQKKQQVKLSLKQQLEALEGQEDKREEAEARAQDLETCINEADQNTLDKLQYTQGIISNTVLGLVDDVSILELCNTKYYSETGNRNNGRRSGWDSMNVGKQI